MKFFTTATTLVLLAAVFGATEARTIRRQPSTKVHSVKTLQRRAEDPVQEVPKAAPVKKAVPVPAPGIKTGTKTGAKKVEPEQPTKKGATAKGKSPTGNTTKTAIAKKGAKKTFIGKKGSTGKKTTTKVGTKSTTGKKTTKTSGSKKLPANPKVVRNTKKVEPKKAPGTTKKVVTTPPVPKKVVPTPPVPKKVVPTPKVPKVPEQPKQPVSPPVQPPVQPPVVVTPPKAPEPQPPVVVAPPKAPEPQPPVVVAPPKAPEPQPPVVVTPPKVPEPAPKAPEVTPPVVAPPVIPPKLPINDDKNALALNVNQCASAPFKSFLDLNSLTASPAPLTVKSPLTLTIDGNFLKPLEKGSKLSVFAFVNFLGFETGETQELDMCEELRSSSGLECPLPAGRHVLKFVVPKDRLKPMSFTVRGTATLKGETLFCFQSALKIAKE